VNLTTRRLGVGLLAVAVAALLFFRLDIFRPLRYRYFYKLVLSNSRTVTDAMNILYQAKGEQTFNNISWFGTPVQKNPMDLFIYQELLYQLQPDVVVECGTYKGGSAHFMAHIMDGIGKGRILTIDIEKYPGLPEHPRITYLLGSSTAPEIVSRVKASIQPGERVMVFLDSDHRMTHVLNELRLYHSLVTPGSYLVVEDTDMNGHPILPKAGPGPWEAVEAFLKENRDFQPDASREKLMLTFNPRGYLRRLR
jgi:cephalosporin hydroxylase